MAALAACLEDTFVAKFNPGSAHHSGSYSRDDEFKVQSCNRRYLRSTNREAGGWRSENADQRDRAGTCTRISRDDLAYRIYPVVLS